MWFEVKIKRYDGEQDSVISEGFIFDAENWSHAEQQIFKHAEENGFVDTKIISIKRANLDGIQNYTTGEEWLRVVIRIMDIDSVKEKYIKLNYLILADDIDQAIHRTLESTDADKVRDILKVEFSNIVEVIKNNHEDN